MQFEEGHTVGIDLGTTFSTIAYLDTEGNPVPVENEDEDVETPSLVLLAASGHVIVGPNRMRAAMEDPENVVDRVKRYMGDTDFKRTFDGNEITPEFLSALILKKLKQDGEKRIGKIGNAVITVPYYFNDVRRKATQDAGRIAGINVVDIINEPTAATLTYAWKRGELGTGSEERADAQLRSRKETGVFVPDAAVPGPLLAIARAGEQSEEQEDAGASEQQCRESAARAPSRDLDTSHDHQVGHAVREHVREAEGQVAVEHDDPAVPHEPGRGEHVQLGPVHPRALPAQPGLAQGVAGEEAPVQTRTHPRAPAG